MKNIHINQVIPEIFSQIPTLSSNQARPSESYFPMKDINIANTEYTSNTEIQKAFLANQKEINDQDLETILETTSSVTISVWDIGCPCNKTKTYYVCINGPEPNNGGLILQVVEHKSLCDCCCPEMYILNKVDSNGALQPLANWIYRPETSCSCNYHEFLVERATNGKDPSIIITSNNLIGTIRLISNYLVVFDQKNMFRYFMGVPRQCCTSKCCSCCSDLSCCSCCSCCCTGHCCCCGYSIDRLMATLGIYYGTMAKKKPRDCCGKKFECCDANLEMLPKWGWCCGDNQIPLNPGKIDFHKKQECCQGNSCCCCEKITYRFELNFPPVSNADDKLWLICTNIFANIWVFGL